MDIGCIKVRPTHNPIVKIVESGINVGLEFAPDNFHVPTVNRKKILKLENKIIETLKDIKVS